MSDVPSRLRVSKSNAIINAGYRLSLNEQRVVLYGISLINPLSKEFPLKNTINVRDLAKFYGIDISVNTKFCQEIREAIIKKFWEREFSYYDGKKGKIVSRRWLAGIDHGGEDPDEITYYYNSLIKEELQQLTKYTSYCLSTVSDMKSTYSIRIYEIALMELNASKINKHCFTKTIEDLKFNLGIEGKYTLFSDFRIYVLEAARKEINKKSDLKIDFSYKKKGRAVHSVMFTVSKKDSSNSKRCSKTPSLFAPRLKTETIEKAKAMCLAKRLDVYAIKDEFDKSITNSTEEIRNIDAYFIGFVKKKIS